MYEPRIYRDVMQNGRFHSFTILVEETDLWIGTGKKINNIEQEYLEEYIISLRTQLKDYMHFNRNFSFSHIPVMINEGDPEIIKMMKSSTIAAGTGPMASVAGMVALNTGLKLGEMYPEMEIVVENGGDIFMKIQDNLILNMFPSKSPYFKDLAMEIPPDQGILSVCSSSGKFGHSYSYGTADLVSVFAENTCLADAWATSLANKVRNYEDIEKIVKDIPLDIIAVLAIKDKKAGYKGPFRFVNI